MKGYAVELRASKWTCKCKEHSLSGMCYAPESQKITVEQSYYDGSFFHGLKTRCERERRFGAAQAAMKTTNNERVEGAIIQMRDVILGGWAIDTEDGILCQYCGAEVKPEHKNDNSENILRGYCKYECGHGDDCIVLIAPDVVPVLGEAASTINLCEFLNWYTDTDVVHGNDTLMKAIEMYLKDMTKAVFA